MQIIVNADDFGMDRDTLEATIACFHSRAITSATLMAGMPATEAALAFAAEHPELSFGVHLFFGRVTTEKPISPPQTIPSLVQDDGRLRPAAEIRWGGVYGRLSEQDIATEMAAQIEYFVQRGLKISHVDSHWHMHKMRPFFDALQTVLPQFGITHVRGAQNVFTARPWRSPTYWLGSYWHRRITRSFKTTDLLFMSHTSDLAWPTRLLRKLPTSGSIEVCVHPGRDESWRQREYEAATAFSTAAEHVGHKLVGWQELDK